ncbi:hypothetical protein PR202_gb21643 [Eleusine coracana subsp. coracana]|uniref:Uncharacterized protein n=1 Tax=Eleusine coracana subsp. coracana TaxID=191504 RepID=A0AAV5FE58_ELECO|nr:hypothetical protein QOZ80_7BG0608510 [Eleusine coracana subsp. coracana]GJN33081.1 hypothetical protein PR202_gb21643 [Eleusine coracana subsp. coracana]
MGLSRRFLNLIVDNNIPGIRSLCCIDLTLEKFFQAPLRATAIGGGSESSAADVANPCNLKHKQAVGAAISMEELQLPNRTISFKTQPESLWWSINCFAFPDSKSGRAVPSSLMLTRIAW